MRAKCTVLWRQLSAVTIVYLGEISAGNSVQGYVERGAEMYQGGHYTREGSKQAKPEVATTVSSRAGFFLVFLELEEWLQVVGNGIFS